jgi:carboxymethylenebutenolidase
MISATAAVALLTAASAGVEWVTIPSPGGGAMRAAVARPAGRGPFPVVVVLHGTHGLGQEYVDLARDLASGGVMAVAPCWFSGGGGPGARFVTPIDCAGAPPMPNASSPEAMAIVGALVEAAGALPGADPRRIGLFGHSRGGGAVLNYVLGPGRVQAAALHSSGYGPGVAERIAALDAPLLILHGTADGPADGGSTFTDVQRARDFEAALRRAGKDVETMYTDGGGHNSFFTSATQRRAETRRMIEFFRRTLSRPAAEATGGQLFASRARTAAARSFARAANDSASASFALRKASSSI